MATNRSIRRALMRRLFRKLDELRAWYGLDQAGSGEPDPVVATAVNAVVAAAEAAAEPIDSAPPLPAPLQLAPWQQIDGLGAAVRCVHGTTLVVSRIYPQLHEGYSWTVTVGNEIRSGEAFDFAMARDQADKALGTIRVLKVPLTGWEQQGSVYTRRAYRVTGEWTPLVWVQPHPISGLAGWVSSHAGLFACFATADDAMLCTDVDLLHEGYTLTGPEPTPERYNALWAQRVEEANASARTFRYNDNRVEIAGEKVQVFDAQPFSFRARGPYNWNPPAEVEYNGRRWLAEAVMRWARPPAYWSDDMRGSESQFIFLRDDVEIRPWYVQQEIDTGYFTPYTPSKPAQETP